MLSILRVGIAPRQDFEQLLKEITECIAYKEATPALKENLIGDVPWSLKTWMLDESNPTLRDHEGSVYVEFGPDRKLRGVSCSLHTEGVLGLTGKEYRVGCRMWIHPSVRNQNRPTLVHVLPALETARFLGMDYAWISFNEDRAALCRRIQMLKSSKSPSIASAWKHWKVASETQVINNVPQYVAHVSVKDFWKEYEHSRALFAV